MEKQVSALKILCKKTRPSLWLALTIFLLATNALRAATFTASLDNDSISLGDSVTLSLVVEGGSSESQPIPPSVDGLRITGRGSSQQISIMNGASTSKTITSYILTPQRTGEFTIPAITVTVGRQKLTSEPLKLTVAKPGTPSPEAINSGSQLVFMKLKVPKPEVFGGETFVAELDVYVREGLPAGNFQITSTMGDNFTVGKTAKGEERRERVGNFVYTVVPFLITMTPTRIGEFTIGPVTASIVVDLTDGSIGFFARTDRRQLSLATDIVSIRSLPLPKENVPPGFNGAIGKFTMTVTAGPTNVVVGDPITLRTQIKGRGALDSLTLPVENQFNDFKTYPPTSKIETTDTLGIEGTKTFEEIVVPQSTDVRELPAISFSYFDPDLKAYQTLTQPATQLIVKPAGANVAPTILAGSAPAGKSAPPAQDIAPVKQRLGTVHRSDIVLVQQKWFVVAQSVPVLAWMAAFVWRKRKDNLANNPRLRRQRAVAKVIESGMIELRAFAQQNKPEEFFATVFRLLQERLGERLDLPASAITEAVIGERLRRGNVPEPTLQSLEELFQMCNVVRYAPVRGSQELSTLIPKLKTTLDELNEVKT